MTLPGRDVPFKEFLSALGKQWKEDRVTDLAASLTFFGVLALFPFLLFLVALAGIVISPQQIDALVQQLAQVAPGEAVKILGTQIHAIHDSQSGGLLTLGIVGALWSASGGMASLMVALNLVYDVEEERPFWKVRGVALLATLGAGAGVLAAALLGVAAGPVAQAIGGPIGTVILWARLPAAGLLMMVVWAVLYRVLPDVEQRFKFLTPGSIAGVVLWVVASWGFSIYVSHFGSYNKTYGAIGAVIVLLMWMWISAIVLLAGAEINATIEQLSPEGKRTGAKSMADTGADRPKAEKHERGAPAPGAIAVQRAPSKGKIALGGGVPLPAQAPPRLKTAYKARSCLSTRTRPSASRSSSARSSKTSSFPTRRCRPTRWSSSSPSATPSTSTWPASTRESSTGRARCRRSCSSRSRRWASSA
jgi:membrane protein